MIIFIIVASVIVTSCGISSGSEETDTLVSDSLNSDSEKSDSLVFADGEAAIKYMRESGQWNMYSKGILPRMANENLDYCTRLLNNKFDYFIVADKRRMKVILFDKYGEEVKSYGMACARNFGNKHKKGDNRTSEGFFTARGIYDSTDWLYTDDNGNTSQTRGQFGPRFIRLNIPNTMSIGIHGTGSPWSIGKRVTHGCMRLTNENILDLVKYAKKGMPIIVIPGDNDQIVNKKEGRLMPVITTRLDGVDDAPKFPLIYSSSDHKIAKSNSEEENDSQEEINDSDSESSQGPLANPELQPQYPSSNVESPQ